MSPIAGVLPTSCAAIIKIVAAKLIEENERAVNGFPPGLRRGAKRPLRRGREPGATETPEDASGRRASDDEFRGAGGGGVRPIEGVREGGGAAGGVNAAAGACGAGRGSSPERRGPRSRRGLRPPREPSREPSLRLPLQLRGRAMAALASPSGGAAGLSADALSAPASTRGMVCPISFSIAAMDL